MFHFFRVSDYNEGKVMGIFEHYQQRYEKAREEEYTIQEFLDMCKQDKACYASAAERLLVAIGEPDNKPPRPPGELGLADCWITNSDLVA